MRGQMMAFPLTIQHIFERARRLYPGKEVVTRTGPDSWHRYSYAEFGQRARQLAGALAALGVRRGDRVGTFAWNSYRHLEAYFAVPCSGAVLHTINIRLFPEQIAYIVNHAQDRVLLVDASLLQTLVPVKDQLRSVEHVVAMPDGGDARAWPGPTIDYEEALAGVSPVPHFPGLEEDEACGLCYTSGTTGNPKGVLYSHRALVLHSFAVCLADSIALCERDTVLPVVPMFHANAWGLPYAATMVGARQVFPGPAPTPAELARLIADEGVTLAAGVPTVWIGVQAALEQGSYDLSRLRRLVVGGAAVPRALIETFEKRFGVPIWQGWGMTEMSPLGSLSRLKSALEGLGEEERFSIRAKQGLPVPGVEIKAVDEAGAEVPWDGRTMGELLVRGPWVAAAYYRDATSGDRFLADGWFRTGDVVTIDPEGYIQVVDRTKDLVKSGGEWISSVELENALMGHPGVLEAAVIARPDERWQERPVACVVPRPGQTVTAEELLEHLRPRFAGWWLPDEVVFLPEIPKTGVGKFDKKVLRERYAAGALAPVGPAAAG
jgi:fatty-acyl-CoA synthase